MSNSTVRGNADLARCLCWDSDKQDYCYDDQCNDYVSSVFSRAPAEFIVILAFLALFFPLILTFIIGWCCRMGGACSKKPRTQSKSGYCHYISFSVITLIVFTISVVHIQWSLKNMDGLENLRDDVVSSADNAADIINSYARDISRMSDVEVISILVLENSTLVTENTNDATKNVRNTARNLTDGLQSDIILLGVVSVFFSLAVLLVIFNLKCMLIGIVPLFFVSALVFLVVQLLMVLMVPLSHDLCNNYQNVTESVVDILRGKELCGEGSQLGLIQSTNEEIISDYVARSKNDYLPELCADFFECSNYSSIVDIKGVAAILSTAKIVNGSGMCEAGQCNVFDCVEQCEMETAIQRNASRQVHRYNVMSQSTEDIINTSYPLSNCSSIFTWANNSYTSICADNDHSIITYVKTAHGFCMTAAVCVMMVLATFSGICAIKRPEPETEEQVVVVVQDIEQSQLLCKGVPVLTYGGETSACGVVLNGTSDASVVGKTIQ